MARFSGLEIDPCIVLEGRILSNAFASRDFLWSDHGPQSRWDIGIHGGRINLAFLLVENNLVSGINLLLSKHKNIELELAAERKQRGGQVDDQSGEKSNIPLVSARQKLSRYAPMKSLASFLCLAVGA